MAKPTWLWFVRPIRFDLTRNSNAALELRRHRFQDNPSNHELIGQVSIIRKSYVYMLNIHQEKRWFCLYFHQVYHPDKGLCRVIIELKMTSFLVCWLWCKVQWQKLWGEHMMFIITFIFDIMAFLGRRSCMSLDDAWTHMLMNWAELQHFT